MSLPLSLLLVVTKTVLMLCLWLPYDAGNIADEQRQHMQLPMA